MDVTSLILRDRDIRFTATPAADGAFAGEGLSHWTCRFDADEGSFVVPVTTSDAVEPDAALTLRLLGLDMRDVGDGLDAARVARAWGVDEDEARAATDRLMSIVADAEAVLGQSAVAALASGRADALAAADAVLLSL